MEPPRPAAIATTTLATDSRFRHPLMRVQRSTEKNSSTDN
ncbi:hypothetical protein UO65_6123 [Actinokineospora spheciospongiae]|uniref:Uncharacterized protein n=1 Tax=Actinokineospora spheciospongiae TaxID=909613 RepID=W7IPD8_9PSEU|nr:hypothetical protein UO65_6123 [Actinokineospora spheciospongiae]